MSDAFRIISEEIGVLMASALVGVLVIAGLSIIDGLVWIIRDFLRERR